MDDIGRIHRKVADDLLKIKGIQYMDLPARSSDLNLIEYMYGTFSRDAWQGVTRSSNKPSVEIGVTRRAGIEASAIHITSF